MIEIDYIERGGSDNYWIEKYLVDSTRKLISSTVWKIILILSHCSLKEDDKDGICDFLLYVKWVFTSFTCLICVIELGRFSVGLYGKWDW